MARVSVCLGINVRAASWCERVLAVLNERTYAHVGGALVPRSVVWKHASLALSPTLSNIITGTIKIRELI